MATRRRMVGECVEPRLVSRALALDTMSNSFTRLLGPIFAGVLYQQLGLAGAFAVSAAIYALAGLLAATAVLIWAERRWGPPPERYDATQYGNCDRPDRECKNLRSRFPS